MALNQVLLGIKVSSSEGHTAVTEILLELKSWLKFKRVSSIYRIQGEREDAGHIHDLRSIQVFEAFVAGCLAESEMEVWTLARRLTETEARMRSVARQRRVNLYLEMYGQQVLMTPELTIPFPELHLRPELLMPAVEVAPEWHHPVLGRTLRLLAAGLPSGPWGEFVGQSESPLAF